MTTGTDAFEALLELEARQQGLPSLANIIVPHPIGGLKPEVVREKVTPEVVDRVLAALTRSK